MVHLAGITVAQAALPVSLWPMRSARGSMGVHLDLVGVVQNGMNGPCGLCLAPLQTRPLPPCVAGEQGR